MREQSLTSGNSPEMQPSTVTWSDREPGGAHADNAQPGTRSANGQITVNASPERVWQALTDANELERWFPLDARVVPGRGGSIWMSWRNEFSGEMEILEWDPPHHLRTSWSFGETELHAQVTDYEIRSEGGSTVVRVVTSGFPLDASWDGWVEGTVRGWAFELRSLKHYLERHAGEPRHVAYVRRRVPGSREELWQRLTRDDGFRRLEASARVFDHRPGSQYAAVLRDPVGGLFRVSVEPGAAGAPENEVVVWLSAWGDRARSVEALRSEWAGRLAKL